MTSSHHALVALTAVALLLAGCVPSEQPADSTSEALPSTAETESGPEAAEEESSPEAQPEPTAGEEPEGNAIDEPTVNSPSDVPSQTPESVSASQPQAELPPQPAVEDSAAGAVQAQTEVMPNCQTPDAGCTYQVTMYNIDGDPYYDPYVADYSGNGILDQNLVEANGVLVWLFDVNENAVPDQFGGDTNADAVPDVWLLDLNEDSVMDSVEVDPAVHTAPPVVSGGGGTDIIIDHGDIPIDPPGMADAVTGLLMPGTRTSTDFCTFLNSAALIGSGFYCEIR